MLNIIAVEISLFTLSLMGIVLNAMCIYILRTSRTLKSKASSLLILNLLVLHLGQSIFVFPFYALKKMKFSNFTFIKFVANGWRLTYIISFYGTVLCVLYISFDRFLATYLLNKYKTLVTVKRMKIAIIGLWVYITALCCIPFIPEVKSGDGNNSNNTYIKPQKYVYIPQKAWVVFMLSVNTVLPYILILICYIFIIRKLSKLQSLKDDSYVDSSSPITLNESLNNTQTLREKDLKRYKRVTRLTLVLSVAYGIFWSPSVVYFIILETCSSCFSKDWDGSNTEQHLGFIIKYLAFMDAIAAPLIYCFMHSEFRKELRRIKSKIMQDEHAKYSEGETTDMVS